MESQTVSFLPCRYFGKEGEDTAGDERLMVEVSGETDVAAVRRALAAQLKPKTSGFGPWKKFHEIKPENIHLFVPCAAGHDINVASRNMSERDAGEEEKEELTCSPPRHGITRTHMEGGGGAEGSGEDTSLVLSPLVTISSVLSPMMNKKESKTMKQQGEVVGKGGVEDPAAYHTSVQANETRSTGEDVVVLERGRRNAMPTTTPPPPPPPLRWYYSIEDVGYGDDVFDLCDLCTCCNDLLTCCCAARELVEIRNDSRKKKNNNNNNQGMPPQVPAAAGTTCNGYPAQGAHALPPQGVTQYKYYGNCGAGVDGGGAAAPGYYSGYQGNGAYAENPYSNGGGAGSGEYSYNNANPPLTTTNTTYPYPVTGVPNGYGAPPNAIGGGYGYRNEGNVYYSNKVQEL